MTLNNYSIVRREGNGDVVNYIARLDDEGLPSELTNKAKLALRFPDEISASDLISRCITLSGSTFSIVSIEDRAPTVAINRTGFSVFLNGTVSTAKHMGGSIDGTSVTNDFESADVKIADLAPGASSIFYVNRVIVPKSLRNFGVAEAMMTALCSAIDHQIPGAALVAELSPYDESVSREDLEKLFGRHGFKRKGKTFLVRANAPAQVIEPG